VLLEAAACGRPIVTTDERGCREAVRHGDNGLLVLPRNAASLAEAMRTLIQDGAQRLAMGKRGRERAMQEFDVKSVVNRTLTIYQDAMQRAALRR
jgi:glycosyltransferase involved in cell wall biosynthesis